MAPKSGPRSGLLAVAGGFSQMISAGREKDATGKRGPRRQFRLKLAIDESYGPPQARRALAVARLADIVAMRDALVAVGRGAQAAYLMRKAGAVAGDEEKFQFAIAAANVVMTRPSQGASEASSRFTTWGALARAWGSQELARLYPNAGYGKKSAEATDEPRIEYLCKFIENVPLATFNDDDYWRAMRPARERCKTDSTFKAYAQVCRRVLKIAVELRVIPAWPLSAVCKLPIVAKGEAPEFPFLYPEEYCRLMRCALIPIQHRVLWGFIIREGLRLGEAFRIRWEHLAQLPAQPGMPARWVLNVPETKTGRALMFVLNAGTGEVLEAFRRLRPELAGPFVWLSATNLKKAADTLRRHVEQSGTTRERLLYTEGRLRRLREHDLRSTFVSWCKLAGIDNETIAQHTGHESNTMIARYNRSKATIEHLGLAPYLPLDQAMGLDVAGELAGPELAARGEVPQLGSGEATAAALDPLQSTDIDAEGELIGGESSAELGAAPARERLTTGFPAGAPSEAPCPDCARPMARVRSESGRNGWTCPSCNAACDPEGDWLEPREPGCTCHWEAGDSPCPVHGEAELGTPAVTSPLHEPAGSANAQRTAEAGAVLGAATAALGAGASARRRGAQGRRGGSGGLGRRGRLRSSPPGAGVSHSSPSSEGATSATPARNTQKPAPAARDAGAGSDLEPLNGCNPCDPGCDPAPGGAGSLVPENEETSRIDAECARQGSNLHSRGSWNLNPAFGDRRKQKPQKPGGEPVPEATGSGGGSHPGVTTPATPLELLQAAGFAYLKAGNWEALRALEPLIDAELARLAEAARTAPPEPVRLEVVRAQRERGQR